MKFKFSPTHSIPTHLQIMHLSLIIQNAPAAYVSHGKQ